MFDYLFLPKEEQSVVQRTGPSPYFQGHDRRPFYFWDDFYPLVDKKGIPPELRIVERRERFAEKENPSVTCAGQEARAKVGKGM